MAKERLDILLVKRGLVESREKAKTTLMAGLVLVDGQKIDKAGTMVKEEAELRILGNAIPYVSRGGLKLEKAIEVFGISLEGKTAADIGASTGGFTDCALQRGAAKVFAIDVGYGQLAWKLRSDPRVVNMERTNILRHRAGLRHNEDVFFRQCFIGWQFIRNLDRHLTHSFQKGAVCKR